MSSAPEYDLVFKSGKVVDGTGRAAYTADVAVKDGKIVKIGRVELHAEEIYDATGMVVAPGFVDVHTHDDAALISNPDMWPKISQGVTTVIAGNCGISGAPHSRVDEPQDLLRLVFKSNALMGATFREFVGKVEGARPAVNSAFLTGHATLRTQVMGSQLDRPATTAEIARMKELLRSCLQYGSFGLSTGLFYNAAKAAPTSEISELASVLESFNGLYVTHMRDESDFVLESLKEAFEIGRAGKVARTIISHHKCMGRANFGRSTETLSVISEALREQPIGLDAYPYTAGSSVLTEELVSKSSKTVVTWSEPMPEASGRDLAELAVEMGCSAVDAVAKLLPAGALYFLMDEADVVRILQFPHTMIGSDGLPGDSHPHPRLWGTFPRVLARYVRATSALTLEDAIHRMTGLPAEQFRLGQRGHVAEGFHADICLFDPETILDVASYETPALPAQGVKLVMVNGEVVLRDGVRTGARAGRVLLRQEQFA
jgi:N-acyl-D-amino-acid deacylase